MRRREFLGLAAVPFAQAIGAPGVNSSHSPVVDTDGVTVPDVELVSDLNPPFTRLHIVNSGRVPRRIKNVIVLETPAGMPDRASLYGEGFQMLTQTAGTLLAPVDLSQYTDEKHYRIPAGGRSRAYYGLLALTPPRGDSRMFAFTSCARFSGWFDVRGSAIRAVVDTESLEIRPQEAWDLEELMVDAGPSRTALLRALADRIAHHHPSLLTVSPPSPPTGWCSWYCFGPGVTARQVLDNLDVIGRDYAALRYVQIDDGYQSAMGDWLSTGAAFGGDVRRVLDAIRQRGCEPAIWVAPFVAEAGSALFRDHSDWFIKDAEGSPLRSDRVTFGGWRRGPWYALDGTHPEAQAHLERVFSTMRSEWGCTYFKLDANFWGAMHGGRFHDPRATRVEAYRRGMAAIRRGAGDAFLLGCNHPIWPSFGTVHGSRSSNDIKRSWDRIASTARQNLSRNWQNGRLWWNDPDAVVLAGELTDAECQFHATAIYASGGMVLSGDDLTRMPPARAAMLQRLLPPTGVAAEFEDASLRVGVTRLPEARVISLFNWDDRPATLTAPIDRSAAVFDVWADRALGRRDTNLRVEMPPRSARLLRLTA